MMRTPVTVYLTAQDLQELYKLGTQDGFRRPSGPQCKSRVISRLVAQEIARNSPRDSRVFEDNVVELRRAAR